MEEAGIQSRLTFSERTVTDLSDPSAAGSHGQGQRYALGDTALGRAAVEATGGRGDPGGRTMTPFRGSCSVLGAVGALQREFCAHHR